MTQHSETRDLPYSAEQMYALVADVESYPEFIPWTTGARVRDRRKVPGGEEMVADLVVSFKVFRERYTSRVHLKPAEADGVARVDVEAIDGPFEKLVTLYSFTPRDGGGCTMGLDVDFRFRSRIMQRAAGVAFELALKRVTKAFEGRAEEIYGPA
jgi:coenzyme Q-binding protein COQ10